MYQKELVCANLMCFDLDVGSPYLSKIWTRSVFAPLLLSLHRASPRLA